MSYFDVTTLYLSRVGPWEPQLASLTLQYLPMYAHLPKAVYLSRLNALSRRSLTRRRDEGLEPAQTCGHANEPQTRSFQAGPVSHELSRSLGCIPSFSLTFAGFLKLLKLLGGSHRFSEVTERPHPYPSQQLNIKTSLLLRLRTLSTHRENTSIFILSLIIVSLKLGAR